MLLAIRNQPTLLVRVEGSNTELGLGHNVSKTHSYSANFTTGYLRTLRRRAFSKSGLPDL